MKRARPVARVPERDPLRYDASRGTYYGSRYPRHSSTANRSLLQRRRRHSQLGAALLIKATLRLSQLPDTDSPPLPPRRLAALGEMAGAVDGVGVDGAGGAGHTCAGGDEAGAHAAAAEGKSRRKMRKLLSVAQLLYRDPLLYDIEQYVEMHRAADGGEHDDDGAHAGDGAVAAAAAQAEAEAAVAAASALAGRRGAQGPHGNYVDSGGRRRGRVGPGRKRVRRTSSVAQLRYDDLEVLGLQDFMISHLAHPRSPHVAAQVQYDDVEVVEAGAPPPPSGQSPARRPGDSTSPVYGSARRLRAAVLHLGSLLRALSLGLLLLVSLPTRAYAAPCTTMLTDSNGHTTCDTCWFAGIKVLKGSNPSDGAAALAALLALNNSLPCGITHTATGLSQITAAVSVGVTGNEKLNALYLVAPRMLTRGSVGAFSAVELQLVMAAVSTTNKWEQLDAVAECVRLGYQGSPVPFALLTNIVTALDGKVGMSAGAQLAWVNLAASKIAFASKTHVSLVVGLLNQLKSGTDSGGITAADLQDVVQMVGPSMGCISCADLALIIDTLLSGPTVILCIVNLSDYIYDRSNHAAIRPVLAKWKLDGVGQESDTLLSYDEAAATNKMSPCAELIEVRR